MGIFVPLICKRSRSSSPCESKCSRGTSRINAGGIGSRLARCVAHEAVGHGLEGDFNRKESSLFTGKIGELVTSPLCTIVDDGTLQNRRGSLTIDDEGVPSQCNVLIKDGILQGYMQDKLNARLMGMKPTGNGRRESYAHFQCHE